MDTRASGPGRGRYRSRAEADELAAEFEASGLRRREFCERRGVPLKTLSRYLKRFRQQPAEGGETQRWVGVEVTESGAGGSGLSVALGGGRRIEVERGFDAATLEQLVAALERG